MATEVQYVRPTLYPKQREFVDSTSRYTIVEASTKTGKTVACLVWLLERALEGKSGQNYWWIAPTYKVAGIAYGRLRRWLSQSGLPETHWRPKEAEQAVEFANGTKITFKGADNPDLLYGEDVWGAVIDEGTRVKEAAYHAVRSTLTATRGPLKIIGNVRGKRNWVYNMARRAQAGVRDMAYFKLTAWDAVAGGVLDAEEIHDAERTLPPEIFRQLYLAEPADDGGNPFGAAAIAECATGMSHGPPAAFGVDLAKSSDFTVVCGLNGGGGVCVLERFRSDWAQIRRRVLDLIGTVPTLIDSTGVGDPIVEDIQRVQSTVEGFHFTSPSKQQLMEGLAAAIQRHEVSFPDGWLRQELDTFEYEMTRTGVRYSAPPGLHDDGVCALALARQKLAAVLYQPKVELAPMFFGYS